MYQLQYQYCTDTSTSIGTYCGTQLANARKLAGQRRTGGCKCVLGAVALPWHCRGHTASPLHDGGGGGSAALSACKHGAHPQLDGSFIGRPS